MEESPKSYSANSRKKSRTPPLPPEHFEPPGIDRGAFFPSFRGSSSAPRLTEKAGFVMPVPTTHSGHHTSASAAAPESHVVLIGGKSYTHEGGLQ
jgi:hypothetical protein